MDRDDRAQQIAHLARQFGEYLHQQTDIEIINPGAATDTRGPADVLAAFQRLDAALSQIADLASVYADDPRSMLELLALPAAALMGECLRGGTGARWLEGDEDDLTPVTSDDLVIVLPDGIALDLLGVARAALLSGAPNLTAVAEQILSNQSQ